MPSQYLLGLFMIFLSGTVDRLLEGGDGPQVVPLTAVFFMLAFLAATQVGYRGASPRARHACPPDLCALPLPSGHRRGRLGPDHAVQGERGLRLHLQLRGPDGRILPGQRALPGAGVGGLLQQVPQGGAPGRGHRHPVGYGAPGAGQRAPGGTALLTVVSAVLSAPDFLFFWGMVFLVSTTLVAILKRENAEGGGGRRVQEETQGVTETYKLLFSIIKLPSVFTFCVLLLTAKVGLRLPSFRPPPPAPLQPPALRSLSGGLLRSRRGDGPEAGGGRRAQGDAGAAGGAAGAAADPAASGHQ